MAEQLDLDAALGAAAVLDPLDAHHDSIAVHRLVEVRTGNVDVTAHLERTLGCDEPVAGRMRLQSADVQIQFFGQAEAVTADLNQVAGGNERFDVPLERGPVVAGNFEDLQELAHAGGMVHPLTHQRQHLVA